MAAAKALLKCILEVRNYNNFWFEIQGRGLGVEKEWTMLYGLNDRMLFWLFLVLCWAEWATSTCSYIPIELARRRIPRQCTFSFKQPEYHRQLNFFSVHPGYLAHKRLWTLPLSRCSIQPSMPFRFFFHCQHTDRRHWVRQKLILQLFTTLVDVTQDHATPRSWRQPWLWGPA